jgi:hypothetical protein
LKEVDLLNTCEKHVPNKNTAIFLAIFRNVQEKMELPTVPTSNGAYQGGKTIGFFVKRCRNIPSYKGIIRFRTPEFPLHKWHGPLHLAALWVLS